MSEETEGAWGWDTPDYWPRPPRISGTAMVTGVHLSTGYARTSRDWELVVTGLALMGLAGVAAVVSFLVVWLIDGVTPVPTVGILLGVLPGAMPAHYAYWQVLVNLVVALTFLVVLRLSPLAGYHAAEHMTVTCIERLGRIDPDQVRHMPRAHHRCGSSLLAGILPAFLIAVPLLSVNRELAALIVIAGWVLRDRTGMFLQQVFTTKPPSRKQLMAGIRAGERLLAQINHRHPPSLSPAQRLWRRGVPQMVAGAVAGMWILGRVLDNLHLFLDTGL
ncbi:MAG: DUF1385 domain-containing protein [Armatimonadetes bacterium]|nr:DUF1385 domain-containing protein [Armatimonadota bacterium]